MSAATRTAGPWCNVPAELVLSTSVQCCSCRNYVEKIIQPMPGKAARLIGFGCSCGGVMGFESNLRDPTPQQWRRTIRLMRRLKLRLLMIKGPRELDASFSGIN